jgi:CTP synthase
MQLAVVEYARNILKIKDTHTTEVNPKTKNPIITILDTQKGNLENKKYGGSMRLGTYAAHIKDSTLAKKLYGKNIIEERHRHRYEVNPEYHERLESAGMRISAMSPEGHLTEMIELPESIHPYFIAGQFHPEFLSHPGKPHPLFSGLIKAIKKK